MSLRFHEISESRHRILNPLSAEKLRLVGEICELDDSMELLDLCCGKAEMLSTWAATYGSSGVGVDISAVFLGAARQRAAELHVDHLVTLVEADAARYVVDVDTSFHVVSCIGATWIGNGLAGTLELMRPRMKSGGLVLAGEPYWIDPIPESIVVPGLVEGDFASLAGTLDRFESAGFELVEMVAASPDDWDRYVAMQWKTVDDWLISNPASPDSTALGEWIRTERRSYLTIERRHLGWAVFVLRSRR
jgi:SAM-dependent methyltransferase